jgi:hypothetical protein
LVNAYLEVIEIPSLEAYALFVGMGSLGICDGWFLERSDLEVLGIREDGLIEGTLLADGVLLFKDKAPLERIAELIQQRHPDGFCLGCLRKSTKARPTPANSAPKATDGGQSPSWKNDKVPMNDNLILTKGEVRTILDVIDDWESLGRQPYNRELRKTLRGAYDKLLRAMNL